jgi:hypothetical protein
VASAIGSKIVSTARRIGGIDAKTDVIAARTGAIGGGRSPEESGNRVIG